MAADWGSLFSLIQRVQREYPELAYLLDHDEVGPLLLKAVGGQMDVDEFTFKLRQTDWWKTTAEPARKWDAFAQVDPATARAQIDQQRQSIHDQARTLGVDLTLAGRHWIAVTALREGWDEAQITRAIARQADWQGHDDLPGGQIGAVFDQYRTMARDFGVKLSGRDAFKAARKTVVGAQTAEGMEAMLRHQAMERFAGNTAIVDALKNGTSLREYFAPLQNEIAAQLEITPDQVDVVNGRRWQEVISHVDETGNVRPMSIPEATRWVRGTDQWGRTDRADKEASAMADSLGRMFGAVA
jgi:hypothetical protein